MARLYRPYIPIETRCEVLLRQCGYTVGIANDAIRGAKRESGLRILLKSLLVEWARQRHCGVDDLQLDHDPPLAARKRKGKGKRTIYSPPANDPNYLAYRPHGTEFEGSHLIKTNVRGDHGQYPDRVLIKREKKRREGKKAKARGIRRRSSKPMPGSRASPWKKRMDGTIVRR